MKIDQLSALFRLRPVEAGLYRELFYGSGMKAAEAAKRVGISRTAVYDLLERLTALGLAAETLESGVKIFSAVPPEKLRLLLEEKEKEITLAQEAIAGLEDEYSKTRKSAKPRLLIYEGREELQQMMKDLLLYRDSSVLALWPITKVISLLTPSFLSLFHKERVRQNISLKTIWPAGPIPSFDNYPFLKTGADQKREARLAPVSLNFSLGYAIYGNTVRFISSTRENFGFLVESQELAEMMKGQFELVWRNSKPLNAKKN